MYKNWNDTSDIGNKNVDWKQNLYNGSITSRLETEKTLETIFGDLKHLIRRKLLDRASIIEVKIYGLSTESKMGRVVLVVVIWSSILLRINDH